MNKYPLFWCLEPAKQAGLMKFQFDNYGLRLKIPPKLKDIQAEAMESPEELEKIMRQVPEHPKKVK